MMERESPRPQSPLANDPMQLDAPRSPPAFRRAQPIEAALKSALDTDDARVLVVGYSPTGSGHTDRLLNVVDKAIDKESLKPGSTVVFHVPEIWDERPRPEQLENLSKRLADKGIHVIVAQADKSVLGFLNNETLESDDAKILEHVATRPIREKLMTPEERAAKRNHINECLLYGGNNSIDWGNLPSISAKQLMQTMKQILGDQAMQTKVKVLTDMDPALQKAAANCQVPPYNRLDQQNHGILLETDGANHNLNLRPQNAVLAKVLSGMGERVSHVSLGEKNTLANMGPIAARLGITQGTLKVEALRLASERLIEKGETANPRPPSGRAEGLLLHEELRTPEQVKNIVYVYAHATQNRIAQFVHRKLQDPNVEDAYKETLFLFCGTRALTEGGKDALRIASLANADGITTAGAGTVGEYAYLVKKGKSKAGMMLLPIRGHNEQHANAESIERELRPLVRRSNSRDLEQNLDAFIKDRYAQRQQKYVGNMADVLRAVRSEKTYVQQAHDLLFPPARNTRRADADPPSDMSVFREIEEDMRGNPTLKANRRYLKMVFQVLGQVEEMLDNRNLNKNLEVKFKQKDPEPVRYHNLRHFVTTFDNDDRLSEALGSQVDNNVLLNLDNARRVINLAATLSESRFTRTNARTLKRAIAALKTEFGEQYTTGF